MISRRTVGLVLCAAAISASGAAEWSFDPVLTVTGERNSNPEFAGTSGSAETISRGTLHLPLTGSTPRTTGGLIYEPTYERHEQNSELTNLSHFAALNWEHRPSSRARWNAGATWTLWERPRLAFDYPDVAQVALPRIRSTRVAGQLSAEFDISPRARWRFGVDTAATRYGQPEAGQTLAEFGVTDASQYGASLGWQWIASPLTALGLEYRGTRIDEGERGTTDAHRGLVTYTHGRTQGVQYLVSLGVAISRVVDPGQVELQAAPTEVVGAATIAGTAGRRHRLDLGVRRDLGGSGGTVGAAIEQTVFGSWTVLIGRFSHLALLGRYTKLDPIEEQAVGVEATTTHAYRGEFTPALGPHWFLVFSGEHVNQTTSGGGPLELSYNIWGLGVRWAPTAHEAVPGQ